MRAVQQLRPPPFLNVRIRSMSVSRFCSRSVLILASVVLSLPLFAVPTLTITPLTSNVGSLTSVPAGGSMNLIVGNTYVIQLLGGTATQGYNQFEAFINLPNTIFQVLGVSTLYSADNSPYVPGPAPTANDKLYADACL